MVVLGVSSATMAGQAGNRCHDAPTARGDVSPALL